ncbi:hypothetical protein DFH06DRAFT_1133452 [Mycena polygramma]|nr:hypothetical protein DFH06DRAFT_1133452 [Mycena polygramma]
MGPDNLQLTRPKQALLDDAERFERLLLALSTNALMRGSENCDTHGTTKRTQATRRESPESWGFAQYGSLPSEKVVAFADIKPGSFRWLRQLNSMSSRSGLELGVSDGSVDTMTPTPPRRFLSLLRTIRLPCANSAGGLPVVAQLDRRNLPHAAIALSRHVYAQARKLQAIMLRLCPHTPVYELRATIQKYTSSHALPSKMNLWEQTPSDVR